MERNMNMGLPSGFVFGSVNEISEVVQHGDEKDPLWFDLSEDEKVRPFLFDCSGGGWTNLLRVRPGGTLAKHYHVGTVQAMVLAGSSAIWNIGLRPPAHSSSSRLARSTISPIRCGHDLVFVSRGCLICRRCRQADRLR
jgi:hypothetical protein